MNIARKFFDQQEDVYVHNSEQQNLIVKLISQILVKIKNLYNQFA